MKKVTTSSVIAIGCALLAQAGLTSAAQAQSNGGEGGPATSAAMPQDPSDAGIKDIVVTATRRSTNLQQVPVTVTALPAEALKAQNITGVLQLSDAVPGLQVSATGGNNLYLRGVGSTSGGYAEGQVAMYIDGLYLTNPAMSIFSFNNIDQIEVLKGPQGTLYGRNATAGLISVTTRNPGDAPRLDATVGYDNYQTRTETLYGSIPVSDTLAANVAVYDTKQNKGWTRNSLTGRDGQTARETAVQTKLLWKPGSDTKVTANFIYDTNNRTYGLVYQELPGTIASDGTPFLGGDRFVARVDPKAPLKAQIASLKIQQDLGFASLMSLTGYQHSKQDLVALGTVATRDGVVLDFNNSSRSWSQELQLTSRTSASRLDWIAGFFFFNDHTVQSLGMYTTCSGSVCVPGPAPTRATGRPKTNSYSGYLDATYRLFSATKLTVGLRYTNETKSLTSVRVPILGRPDSVASPTLLFPGTSGIPGSTNFEKLTYRIVLAQDFGPNVHAYISDNLGFKSGAYNATSFVNPAVKPETLHAYEAGVKSQFFDRRVRLNLAYFHYDYKDVQARFANPPAPAILRNVAKERLRGLDVDFTIAPFPDFSVNGGFEVLDSKYIDYPGAVCWTKGPDRTVNGVTVGTVTSAICNVAGRKVPYAAPFTGTLGFSYTVDTNRGRFTFSANDRYTSRYSLAPDGSIDAPRAHNVNASLAWTSPERRYDVQLYVRNLTNKYSYAAGVTSTSGFTITPNAPRVFGMTAGLHY
ncbi:hypothetical protein C1T17_06500 [Sphingobium sp. SCG-1]|uniref:TonB-dependent receptor n=1 Tax=Sphingobium sp. SCG-1 TaxID=2072936 RepID=UPI000CD67C2A|nr:TonB-dependent receptor [Sphingobium sp. SCG-1]AUW57809.1 hypothetical protein C1T17_06500 [Sphingobium sp. SCG-1]